MSEVDIQRGFYCNYEQLKELNAFKKNVESISSYYSEEIQEYLFVNKKEDYIKKMFSNNDLIKLLYDKKKIEFLDYVKLSINLKAKIHLMNFKKQNPLINLDAQKDFIYV